MKIPVLDHGYVEFIEAWGHGKAGEAYPGPIGDWGDRAKTDFEAGIIEAARQSTQGSFRGWDSTPCDCSAKDSALGKPHDSDCRAAPGDERLLKFLYDNHHATPFEFAGMVIEVQAPIFVFREWHRHRTQSYNEMSARYTPLPDLYYVPDFKNLMERGNAGSKNRQAQGMTGDLVHEIADGWHKKLQRWYREAEELYQGALEFGIPKELARLSMPVGHYSRMHASANLRNWLAFMTLRSAENAQWEIRQFASAVGQVLEAKFPRTWKLFLNSKGT